MKHFSYLLCAVPRIWDEVSEASDLAGCFPVVVDAELRPHGHVVGQDLGLLEDALLVVDEVLHEGQRAVFQLGQVVLLQGKEG